MGKPTSGAERKARNWYKSCFTTNRRANRRHNKCWKRVASRARRRASKGEGE
jgi:hypothetical protein